MGDIIAFPTSDQIERNGVREALRRYGCSPEMVDWIWSDFEPRFAVMKGNLRLSAPAECDAAIASVTRHFEERIGVAAMQMLVLEVELYHAKFGGAPIDPHKVRLWIVPSGDAG